MFQMKIKNSHIAAVAALILIFAWSAAMGANSKAGTSAYTFLKIGTGAKSQALGGAFVGLADDQTALYYNPAGLTAKGEAEEIYDDLLEKPVEKPVHNQFTASYINYLIDFQYGFLGYTRALDEKTVAGFSIAYQNYGTFNRLNSIGDQIGTFGASDIAMGLTYSKRVRPGLSLGATGKFIYEKIDTYFSDGLAFDVGFMYTRGTGTRAGLMISNFGAQLTGLTKSHKDTLPTKAALGLSHQLRGLPILFSSEVGKPFDSDFYFALGMQVISLQPFYFRLGWTTAGRDYRVGTDKDTLAGFAGGFGYTYRDYTLDYSYSSYADLGSVHRITLGAGF